MGFTSLYYLLQQYIIPLFRIRRLTFFLHISWILFYFILRNLSYCSVLEDLHHEMYFCSWAIISTCYPNFLLIFNSLFSFLPVIWHPLIFLMSAAEIHPLSLFPPPTLPSFKVCVYLCHVIETYILLSASWTY